MPIAGRGDKWLQNFVPYLLYRITNQLSQKLRGRLRQTGINISRWRVMSVLRAHGELALGQIVDLTVMGQPAVSRVVTLLVHEGLAVRRVSKTDSRVSYIRLTRAGEKVFKSVYPTAQLHQSGALRGFSDSEIDSLKKYLHRIQHNIESYD